MSRGCEGRAANQKIGDEMNGAEGAGSIVGQFNIDAAWQGLEQSRRSQFLVASQC